MVTFGAILIKLMWFELGKIRTIWAIHTGEVNGLKLKIKTQRHNAIVLLNGSLPVSFSLFRLFNTFDSREIFYTKVCRWLDSIHGPLVSTKWDAATAQHSLIVFYFFKWANPFPYFVSFLSFQTNNTIFTSNQCEKITCPSSIRHQDSNPWPLKHELNPITTRPGLPPYTSLLFQS